MIAPHLSPRERNIVVVGIAVVGCFVLYSFVVEPLVVRFNDVHEQVAVKELKVKKNAQILQNKKAIEQEYERYAGYLKQKSSDEQEMSSLLSQVESAAQKQQLKITDMKPQKIKVTDTAKNLSIEIEAEGELKDITKFIYTVQNLPYLLSVERLRLERRSSRTSALKVSLLVAKTLIP